MAQITYRFQTKPVVGEVLVSDRGAITSFGDSLARSIFLEGAARSRFNGVEVTVFDEDGKCLVGDVGQLAAGDFPIAS